MYIFTSKTNIKEWKIVNDGVMGGVSKSTMELNEAGNGKFSSVPLSVSGEHCAKRLLWNLFSKQKGMYVKKNEYF